VSNTSTVAARAYDRCGDPLYPPGSAHEGVSYLPLKLLVRMYQQLVGKLRATVAATCLTPPSQSAPADGQSGEKVSYLEMSR